MGPTLDSSLGPSLDCSLGPSLDYILGPTLDYILGCTLDYSLGPSPDENLGPTHSLDCSLGPLLDCILGPTQDYSLGPSLDCSLGPSLDYNLGPTPSLDCSLGPSLDYSLGPTLDSSLGSSLDYRLGSSSGQILNSSHPVQKALDNQSRETGISGCFHFSHLDFSPLETFCLSLTLVLVYVKASIVQNWEFASFFASILQSCHNSDVLHNNINVFMGLYLAAKSQQRCIHGYPRCRPDTLTVPTRLGSHL